MERTYNHKCGESITIKSRKIVIYTPALNPRDCESHTVRRDIAAKILRRFRHEGYSFAHDWKRFFSIRSMRAGK